MVRPFAVLKVLSVLIVVFALAMLLPLCVSLGYGDAARHAYEKAVLITFASGAILWVLTRSRQAELQIRDGFLLVALVWTVLPAFATLPLLIYMPELSFTDGYFETVAALTTTGSTVLSGLDKLPPSINLWRCELQWLGGMGIIVLAVAILPLLGIGGSQIMRTETPGPMKDTKLTPRITGTAKGLWLVYAVMTLACMLVFKAVGMGWFDAVVHSFSTLSLAPCRSDPEAGAYLALVGMSVLGVAYFLFANQVYPSFWTALRHSAFNVVSVATTAGFAGTDFNQWPIFAPVWMLFLCCFATCSGSTGGGIKMIRAELMVRQALRELMSIIHPRAYLPVKLSGQRVENNIIFAVLAFMLIWGGSVVAMTMLLLASGLDIITAFSAVIVCICNTGPGLNLVGPATTYAALSDFQTWVCTVAMLIGRLELFTLFIVVTPAFWRK